jgi:hypothetical protein
MPRSSSTVVDHGMLPTYRRLVGASAMVAEKGFGGRWWVCGRVVSGGGGEEERNGGVFLLARSAGIDRDADKDEYGSKNILE